MKDDRIGYHWRYCIIGLVTHGSSKVLRVRSKDQMLGHVQSKQVYTISSCHENIEQKVESVLVILL